MNKGWFIKLFRKSQDEKTKEVIKKWLIQINQTEKLPQNIVALNFNLYEGPYALDFCPSLEIPDDKSWEEVLKIVESILKDLIREMPDIELFKVQHIAVGFDDGNLIIIK